MEEARYCIDVVTQITAVRALDTAGLALLDSHAGTCMRDPRSAEQADAQVEELMGAVGRMLNS